MLCFSSVNASNLFTGMHFQRQYKGFLRNHWAHQRHQLCVVPVDFQFDRQEICKTNLAGQWASLAGKQRTSVQFCFSWSLSSKVVVCGQSHVTLFLTINET